MHLLFEFKGIKFLYSGKKADYSLLQESDFKKGNIFRETGFSLRGIIKSVSFSVNT